MMLNNTFDRLALSKALATSSKNGTFHVDASETPRNGTFSSEIPGTPRGNGTFSAGRPLPPPAADLTFEKKVPSDGHNSTFNKLGCIEAHAAGTPGRNIIGAGLSPLNATFDAGHGSGEENGPVVRASPGGLAAAAGGGLNSTFNRSNSSGGGGGGGGGLNATFNRSNSSGGPPGRGEMAGGFGGRGSGGSQRKMSEDRLSSASSG